METRRPWVSVVETTAYLAKAAKVLSENEQRLVSNMVGADPTVGEVMVGTGGVRKVRFALEGRGKSGGARIVYFFHNETMPVFLLTVFAKKEKDNLSAAERNALKKYCTQTVKDFTKKG